MGEAKQKRDAHNKRIDDLTKGIVDTGLLITAGFALHMKAVYPDATPEQMKEHYFTYMSGAQHLWGSIFSFLEDGREETADDMRRMGLVQKELDDFAKVIAARLYPTKGSA